MEIIEKNKKKFYIFIYVLSLFIVLMGLLAGYFTGEPIDHFFRDITSTFYLPYYTGFVSQFGNLLWAVLSGICFYNFFLLSSIGQNPDLTRFYFWSFLLVLMLTVDDIFLLHEEAFYIVLGISQKYIYGFYFLAILFYLFIFFRYILKTDYIFFFSGLILFGLSIVLDYIIEIFLLSHNLIALEDFLKLLGISSWIIYFTNTGINHFSKR